MITSLENRRGRFRMNEDVVFSNDPMVDMFFRQVRVYQAKAKDSVVHYKAVSMVFDEVPPRTLEPSYDLYVQDGTLHAERNDFEGT